MNSQATIHVPGKIMLCGEYSALNGTSVLSSTVDQFAKITVSKADAPTYYSELWQGPLDELELERNKNQYRPVYDSALFVKQQLRLDKIQIQLENFWPISYGFGSSSAIRLGILLAANKLLETPLAEEKICYEAIMLQRKAQSRSSGYDTATQFHGGIIEYKPIRDTFVDSTYKYSQEATHRLNSFAKLAISTTGNETAKQINSFTHTLENSNLWPSLNALNAALFATWKQVLTEQASSTKLMPLFAEHRRLCEEIYPQPLTEALNQTNQIDESWSYKTTGAGGSDALLFVGNVTAEVESILENYGWGFYNGAFGANGIRAFRQ